MPSNGLGSRDKKTNEKSEDSTDSSDESTDKTDEIVSNLFSWVLEL